MGGFRTPSRAWGVRGVGGGGFEFKFVFCNKLNSLPDKTDTNIKHEFVNTISDIVFVAFLCVILYHKTRRPQEKKTLKKTVFVIGVLVVCLLPLSFCLVFFLSSVSSTKY